MALGEIEKKRENQVKVEKKLSRIEMALGETEKEIKEMIQRQVGKEQSRSRMALGETEKKKREDTRKSRKKSRVVLKWRWVCESSAETRA